MKRTLLMLAVATTASLTLTQQSAAQVACEGTGTIVSVTAYEDALTEHEIVYKTDALDGAVFTVTTDSDSMAILAATLLTSQAQVAVMSTASACPPDDGGDAGTLNTLMPE